MDEEIQSQLFEERFKKQKVSQLQTDQQVENFAIENLCMLQMLKSDFETSTIHNKSVASKTTVSQVHLLSDLKKTSLQKAIERQLSIYKEREQPSIRENKKQIASVLFTGIF